MVRIPLLETHSDPTKTRVIGIANEPKDEFDYGEEHFSKGTGPINPVGFLVALIVFFSVELMGQPPRSR
jgi:hypothetical protein